MTFEAQLFNQHMDYLRTQAFSSTTLRTRIDHICHKQQLMEHFFCRFSPVCPRILIPRATNNKKLSSARTKTLTRKRKGDRKKKKKRKAIIKLFAIHENAINLLISNIKSLSSFLSAYSQLKLHQKCSFNAKKLCWTKNYSVTTKRFQ